MAIMIPPFLLIAHKETMNVLIRTYPLDLCSLNLNKPTSLIRKFNHSHSPFYSFSTSCPLLILAEGFMLHSNAQ